MTELEIFTKAFIEAMYFADTGEPTEPHSDSELSTEARLDIEAECRSFWRRFGCYVTTEKCANVGTEGPIAQAGHDFCLTRNGHGAGFWDGDWPEPYGEMLSKGAECYGSFDIFENVEGEIEIC